MLSRFKLSLPPMVEDVEDHTTGTVIWLETNLYCDTDQFDINYLLIRSWYLAVSDYISYCHHWDISFC